MTLRLDKARELLASHDQTHVMHHWDQLSTEQQTSLLEQIDSVDFSALHELRAKLDAPPHAASTDFEPAEVMPVSSLDDPRYVQSGEDELREGRVAVLLVAGGQGTRLGYDGPKGSYGVGPITEASLFEIHSRKILALERRYDTQVVLCVMTSPPNDQATKAFFADHNYFGLSRDRVRFFVQGTYPALTPDGKMILDRPDHIFVSPDGHGGIVQALHRSGLLAELDAEGVNTLFYFQVDNPLVDIASTAFLGAHLVNGADMSLKVCAKRDPAEGLGVVVMHDDIFSVVEYSELTEEQKNERLTDGELRFKFGSVAIHIFSLDFLMKEADAALPLHRAHKKVPYCEDDGSTTAPDSPNAFKFEKFIFDALPAARNAAIVEFLREDEFSPLKNAEGADSPQTVQRDISLKFARWLEGCGVDVPRGEDGELSCKIEIDPCYALDPKELDRKLPDDFTITEDVLLK